MSVALFSHSAFDGHVPTPGHAEQIARLEAVRQALSPDKFPELLRFAAPQAAIEDVVRVHEPDYVDLILHGAPEEGWRQLDADTAISAGSAEAALRVAGGVIAALDGVMAGEFNRAFCASRPPGHHARPGQAMGFCLFNGVAIAAKRAIEVYGLERVAVVDFDVHHGNGTQESLWDEPCALYASLHQAPLYPGTGNANERGGIGKTVNAPLPAGTNSTLWRQAYKDHIAPALADFAPQLLLLSAGFDGHQDDPLAQFALRSDDFRWITAKLVDQAMQTAQGRVVSVLEGGYDLDALGRSCAAHVGALGGSTFPKDTK